jgi:hypothetical protein
MKSAIAFLVSVISSISSLAIDYRYQRKRLPIDISFLECDEHTIYFCSQITQDLTSLAQIELLSKSYQMQKLNSKRNSLKSNLQDLRSYSMLFNILSMLHRFPGVI